MGKHTPAAEQRRLIDLWRSSDDSMAGFARAHGVRPGTFATWVKRHRPAPPARAFLRLAVPGDAEAPTTDAERAPSDAAGAVVVHVGDHHLRFETPPPPAWFAAVLHELASC